MKTLPGLADEDDSGPCWMACKLINTGNANIERNVGHADLPSYTNSDVKYNYMFLFSQNVCLFITKLWCWKWILLS